MKSSFLFHIIRTKLFIRPNKLYSVKIIYSIIMAGEVENQTSTTYV